MTDTNPKNARTLEGMVDELADVLAEIDRLNTRAADLRLMIAAKAGTGTHKAGELEVVVKPGARRLDLAKLAAAYPASERPELYVTETKIDTKRARAHFAPAELEAFLGAPGATSVSLK